jgi:phage protein D
VRVTILPSATATSGTPVDLSGRIVSFTFEDAESKADKVSLTLDNFDLSFFDRPELLGGALLEVSWGYPGNMAPPRRVLVKKLKGFTTLTIEGQALSMQMHQKVQTRGWQNVKRSDVVRQIAAEYGYEGASVVIDDTSEVFDVINQCAETDAWFLRRLAAREHFSFWLDDTGFHWHLRKQGTPPTHVFTWYTDPDQGEVISIDVESDLVKRAGGVTVKARDPAGKATTQASANKDSAKRETLGTEVKVVDGEDGSFSALLKRLATDTARPSAAATQSRAQREADARFVRSERETFKLSMQVVGDPTLRAKQIVELRNLSAMLSGKYHVNEVKHTISGSGYVCDLKLTRDSQSHTVASGNANPAQGGAQNNQNPPPGGTLNEYKVPNKETGGFDIAYKGKGAPGAGDPEAKPGGGR